MAFCSESIIVVSGCTGLRTLSAGTDSESCVTSPLLLPKGNGKCTSAITNMTADSKIAMMVFVLIDMQGAKLLNLYLIAHQNLIFL